MINARELWRRSKALRILSIVAAAIALLFVSGFPLGAKVKSDYLSMMRDTVMETENNETDALLSKLNYTQPPENVTEALFTLMKGNISYLPDKDDYSKTPNEFLKERGGDCEDFAVFISYALTKAGVPNKIVVDFSLYGHAYNEFLNSSGKWQTLDFLDEQHGKFFDKKYLNQTSDFNQTANSIGPVANPAQKSVTNWYSRATEFLGGWFRENILYHLLSPYYSTEKIQIS